MIFPQRLRGWVDSVLNVLGLIGFTVRSDKNKDAWKKLDAREWGEPVAGWRLSVLAVPPVVNGSAPVKLRVTLRNDTGSVVRTQIASELHFFQVNIRQDGGQAGVELSPFGRRMLDTQTNHTIGLQLAPGESLHNEIPVSELFEMKKPGSYRVQVSCNALGPNPGNSLKSNEVVIERQ